MDVLSLLIGRDLTVPSPLVVGCNLADAVKRVLGGETLCTTSVSKLTTVRHMNTFITTPDETDIGALGSAVDKTGLATRETGGHT